MGVESSIKLLDYINKVSKDFMTVDGQPFGYGPVERVVLNESFFCKDDCMMCGRCCLNETNVWTREGVERIDNAVPADFEKWGLDFNVIKEIRDRATTVVHSVNGVDIPFYVSDRDPTSEAFKLSWSDRKEQPRCHWLFEKDGTYRCRIHPVRSITCGMPHCRFFHSENSRSTTIGVSQYGRNWALKCPVEFGPLDEESVQVRVLWLTRLCGAAEDCGVDTFLPEILDYLNSGNRRPREFIHHYHRKLFSVRHSLVKAPTIEEPCGFQLYFAGSLNKVFEEDLKNKGANRLASQLLDKAVIDSWIAGRGEGRCKGRLLIDSGAFSAHTRDAEVDVDAYIEYLNNIDEYVHVCAQVDKIPGKFRKPKTRQELEEAPELSWKNYLYMRSKLKSPKKLLPIFHQGEDYKWLTNILEWRDPETGDRVEYMGISPANDEPVKEKIKFIEKCFNIIRKSSNPDICTHAFGMTSLYVLQMYPFTSADSTSWLLNGANGSIMTKFGAVLVSEKSIDNPGHIRLMPKAAQAEIQNYVESKGYTMEGLSKDYTHRIRFNIEYLLDWAKNYHYNPSSVRRRTLF